MSSRRRDNHFTSRSVDPNDRSLPPIREVFPDELGISTQPGPYSFREVQSALPALRSPGHQQPWEGYGGHGRSDHTGPATLPPIQQYVGRSSTAMDTRRSSQGRPPSHQHVGRSGSAYTYTSDDPGYSYGVLRTSGTSGSLTDATPPSDRPQGILRQTAAPAREDPEDINKRYKCEYCGKRFGMPSHLQIHIRVHTAQKPFACEWPGCDRSFSVRSNMTRHFRSHEKHKQSRQVADKSRYEDDDENDTGGEQDEAPSSSQYYHTSSSGSKRSSSQFYSSSRR